MDKPVFPLINIYDSYHVDLLTSDANLFKSTAAEFLDMNAESLVYDAAGNAWRYRLVAKSFKNTLLRRLLAYTVYNPEYETHPVWIKIGQYELDDLKDALKNCVDRDDDVITQYEDADIIKREIDISFTFPDMLDVLNKYVFDVRLDEIAKERKARGEEDL
jgi:hypothetical protein